MRTIMRINIIKSVRGPTAHRPRVRSKIAFAASVLVLWPSVTRADRRAYGQTYEAVTAPQGELDVETWHTYARDGELINGPAARGYRGMLELEYGISPRWDIALYNLLDIVSDPGESGYAGFKIESRIRLAPAGEWFVDPVLYLEYQRLLRGEAAQKAEIKLILGKDLDSWNISTNLAFEVERAIGGQYTPEIEYALGVSREVFGPALKLGLEVFGRAEKPSDEDVKVFVWAGPAISWATTLRGPIRGFWLTLAAGRGLTHQSEAFYGRAITSIQF
jgi:hypothetical protein